MTGSYKRRSGLATLEDNKVVGTARLSHDTEIAVYVHENHPDIVSIDSPLSLPEDPNKIYRDCELELKRRGIGVYWCLLPSMKNLTHRGIKMAKWLRDEGYKVIESYPGAAQDLLGVPRKSKGLDLLRSGLEKYGIVGDLNVSHDELDAITSAIVGQLYLKGEYEALGCLILPKKRMKGG